MAFPPFGQILPETILIQTVLMTAATIPEKPATVKETA
jgi:hypothetical protein